MSDNLPAGAAHGEEIVDLCSGSTLFCVDAFPNLKRYGRVQKRYGCSCLQYRLCRCCAKQRVHTAPTPAVGVGVVVWTRCFATTKEFIDEEIYAQTRMARSRRRRRDPRTRSLVERMSDPEKSGGTEIGRTIF